MKIEFNTDNAAFEDLQSESVRILRDIAKKIESGKVAGKIVDINGNTCGTWWV